MKRAAIMLGSVVVALVGLGFVHPFGNPRTAHASGIDTLLVHASMPANAKAVLIGKCADCHSNETRWPVYARVAPGSWLIERDIIAARGQMNLSQWDQMSNDAQQVAIAKIIHEAKSGEMPPLQYRALHWSAKLTPTDVAALALMGTEKMGRGEPQVPGDATRGKAVFEKRCTGCHAIDADREGPRLAGVFGRRAGSVAGFDYSAGLKNSGMTWNDSTLDRWLTDPESMVPDTKMDFHVARPQERADLIAYLKR